MNLRISLVISFDLLSEALTRLQVAHEEKS